MQEIHWEDPLEVVLIQVDDEFGYYWMETTGFAHIIDSAEGTKSVSFANLDDTEETVPDLVVKYEKERFVCKSIHPPDGSIDPIIFTSLPELIF